MDLDSGVGADALGLKASAPIRIDRAPRNLTALPTLPEKYPEAALLLLARVTGCDRKRQAPGSRRSKQPGEAPLAQR